MEDFIYGLWRLILFLGISLYPCYLAWTYWVSHPSLEVKENYLIQNGLAQVRDGSLLIQKHIYYSSKIATIGEVLAALDCDILQSYIKPNKLLVNDDMLVFQAITMTTHSGFFTWKQVNHTYSAVFQQVQVSDGYAYLLSVEDNPLLSGRLGWSKKDFEKNIRWSYNVFMTQLEKALKELDDNIEVERQIIG